MTTQLTSILLFVLAATSSFALNRDEIRDAIQNEINQRHPNPSPNFWENLGTDAIPVIKQMYGETNDVYIKSWLIEGMSHFNDTTMTSILKNDIRSTDDEVMKKKMLSSLIRSQGEEALEFVEPYLKDEDAHVRLAVAQALNERGGERSRKRIEAFQREEKVAWVKTGVNDPAN